MKNNTRYLNQNRPSATNSEFARDSANRGMTNHIQGVAAETYFIRGIASFKAGRYSDAFDEFTKATDINPEFAEAYCQRANARIMLIHTTPQN